MSQRPSPPPVESAGGEASGAPVIFDAELAPNRSLGRAGFIAVMAGVIVISVGLGVFFLLQGAWPVLGFFGLDIALLAWCFHVNYRQGRRRERLRLTPDALTVERMSPAGRVEQVRLPPWWLRVEIDQSGERPGPLTLATHGQRETVGAFLAPWERVEVAEALRQALAPLRAG